MSNRNSTFVEELIMISMLHQPRFGLEIINLVSEASQGTIQLNLGTLYPALNRLEKRKLIHKSGNHRESQGRNSGSRKYYQITEEGRRLLSDNEAMRQALVVSR